MFCIITTVYHTSRARERDKKEIGRENNSGEGMQRHRHLKHSFPYHIMGQENFVITVLIVTVVVEL